MNKLLKITIISFFLLNSSCSNKIDRPLDSIDLSTTQQKNYLISGSVALDDFKSNKFKTEAVSVNDISTQATVSLLYPADYIIPTLANTAIVAGVTDSTGSFKMNPLDNFTPITDQVYVLEASKRVGGVGNSNISLRTNIKWNGTTWDSITTPNLYITSKTTAISILAHFNKANMTSSDTIGRITMNTNGTSNILYDAKITSNALSRIIDVIFLLLLENKDPVENIYSSTDFYFEGALGRARIDSVKSNAHTLQTMLETYAVDYQGIYPQNLNSLQLVATPIGYWKVLKNPIDILAPSIIDYSEYLDAKNNLTFRGTPISDISDLKGCVVYRFISQTKYEIYALDTTGSFMVDNVFGGQFILTNN